MAEPRDRIPYVDTTVVGSWQFLLPFNYRLVAQKVTMIGYDMMGSGVWIIDVMVMGLTILLFWGALVLAIVWVVPSLAGSHRTQDSVRDLLDRRFAAGEISPEDYARLRQTLQG